jgi:hypothetical protein
MVSNPLALHHVSRRTFLKRSTSGLGAIALATLLRAQDAGPTNVAAAEDVEGQWRGVVNPLHFPARVKRVIHLYMAGGPSHLETFDHKPTLAKMDGEPMPASLTEGQPIAQLQGQKLACYAPRFPFEKYGESGQSICSLFPKIGSLADDLCFIKSMQTEQINHDPAHTFFNTGTALSGRPSIGSWLLYGLGCETDNLPGFIVLTSVGKGGQAQPIAARQWSSGMLPSRFQGVEFQSAGDPVHFVSRPPGVSAMQQRQTVDAIQRLNREQHELTDDPEILTRIAQYEMAFRMQTSVPELADLSDESQETLEMYGTPGADGSFAANCLLARRMAERGVRFIQVYHRAWDHHGGIENAMKITAEEVDRPTWALLTDLKQRGLLEDTLVMWGGEFGRTPMAQGSGRDHHIRGYSYMLAGGPVKGGFSYGATDEFGYYAVENPVHVRDLHATLLQLMGIDHSRLSVKFQGLDIRLTGVEEAHVLQDILA